MSNKNKTLPNDELENSLNAQVRYNISDIKWYDANYYNVVEEEIHPWYQDLHTLLTHPTKTEKLLDIGCGSAIGLKKIVQAGLLEENIYGIDQSNEAIRQARINVPKGNFTPGDAYNLNYDNNFFDYVLLMEVIEHFEQPKIALKEINRVLKINGTFFLSFPNYYNLPWLFLRLAAEYLNKPNWIVLQPVDKIYGIKHVKSLCKEAGFAIEEKSGSVFLPPLIYKYESSSIKKFLNSIHAQNFAFHPLLKMRKIRNI